VVFAPDVVSSSERGWNARLGPAVNRHRESVGLPPVADVRELMLSSEPWLAADPTLVPWRPSRGAPRLALHQTGAWTLPDLRPLSPDLVEFLEAGPPPVYVGFGSMRGLDRSVAGVAVEASRAAGRRVVLGRGWAGLAPADDAEDCFSVGEVNQQALFARVAAVVHHGGAGTTTTAARARAPQVVVPQTGSDQRYWAGRVAQLGVGVAHAGSAPTIDSLSAALETALTPRIREQAAAVAGWIQADGARRAAELLLTRRTRSAVARCAHLCGTTGGSVR
jgi:vancomycin aglycone glucosyltransferase